MSDENSPLPLGLLPEPPRRGLPERVRGVLREWAPIGTVFAAAFAFGAYLHRLPTQKQVDHVAVQVQIEHAARLVSEKHYDEKIADENRTLAAILATLDGMQHTQHEQGDHLWQLLIQSRMTAQTVGAPVIRKPATPLPRSP